MGVFAGVQRAPRQHGRSILPTSVAQRLIYQATARMLPCAPQKKKRLRAPPRKAGLTSLFYLSARAWVKQLHHDRRLGDDSTRGTLDASSVPHGKLAQSRLKWPTAFARIPRTACTTTPPLAAHITPMRRALRPFPRVSWFQSTPQMTALGWKRSLPELPRYRMSGETCSPPLYTTPIP